ncbi:MAG: tRNA (adenosine(37)-N6)-threonylcarbamoyltransferase complex transferase subunit TsaD [Bacteroidales bacterium]|nr:tRNA (adenosine(37)-N6)-threonylcarbamoyltransferase complex transferase subunit TsaD [Bacteroidales bacterium]
MRDGKNIILGIESSCDDTSAAVLCDGFLLSNVMASQEVHRQYGGVIPELASRAHQQNIVPVVSEAVRQAGISLDEVDAIAFTRGPGLLGSLLVGTSFAKGLALSTGKPLVEVNHLQGHILSHFIKVPGKENRAPQFPFLALLVSGGHTQIVRVDDYLKFEILGGTIDDAVGEAFDKCAKMLDLGYPGGPVIDRLAKEGDSSRFRFAKPSIPGLDFSFSGIKTSLLYFLRDRLKETPDFIQNNKNDICASFQKDLIDILMKKLIKAARQTGITQIVAGGGVSANSALRGAITEEGAKRGWTTFLPELKFTTDNAAMIAIVGHYKFLQGLTCPLDAAPISRAADYSL